MVEIALHVPAPEAPPRLSLAGFARHESERQGLERLDALLSEFFPEARPTRLYFGNEFCPHLLAAPEAVVAAFDRAASSALAFTFCAPPAAEAEFERLRPILDGLARCGPSEVVFQDWGTLRILRRDYPGLTPVLGRLLNKGLRDPRVTPLYAQTVPPGEGRAALRAEASSSTPFLRLLATQGVRRIEADALPQGEVLRSPPGFGVSIFLPFGVVTTGRICLAASARDPRPNRFEAVLRCGRECQTHATVFEPPVAAGFAPVPLFEKGNTYFFAQGGRTIRAALESAAAGAIDRLVLQAGLPQWA